MGVQTVFFRYFAHYSVKYYVHSLEIIPQDDYSKLLSSGFDQIIKFGIQQTASNYNNTAQMNAEWLGI